MVLLFARRMFTTLALVLSLLTIFETAKAEILFEGYSKILLSGAHVGFAVQRYEFDSKKQEFISTSFLKTTAQGGNITESLKARSDSKLKPISYQYTTLTNGKPKTIDANFKGTTMTAIVHEGGKTQTIQKQLQKGVFLATFLGYLMLQGKEGIKPQVKYAYLAVAEEDAGVFPGEAYVASAEKYNGQSAFKILNTYHDAQFISYVTAKGDVLATRSPVQGISSELVANMQLATQGLSVNTSSIETLFGGLPKGKENAVARNDSATASPAGTAPAANAAQDKENSLHPAIPIGTPGPGEDAKKSGVPGGQGVMIKAAPAVKPTSLPAKNPNENQPQK
jgi:hypothetical protein